MRRAFVLLLLVPSIVQGDDMLSWPRTVEPLAVAAFVQRVGDTRVLDDLDLTRSTSLQLRAIEASAWLRAPELALPSLVRLASARDPDIAPAAQAAALRIARNLDALDLDRRESDREAILDTRTAYAAIAADESVRTDIRMGARLVVDALESL